MTQRIRGVLAPVVTPFKGDLSPDPKRFIAHCKWLLSQNCGLTVFGTNSEANSLSLEERSILLDALIAAGIDPSRVMPGTGCCSITETVKLTAQAVKHGCAGVLMLPPFYYKGISNEGLYRYFSEVVQRVGDARLRIYLYHIPPVAVVGITTGLVERLLKAYPDTIAGLKDSSGDWNNTKTFLDAFARVGPTVRAAPAVRDRHGDSPTGRAGFDVFVGSESVRAAPAESLDARTGLEMKTESRFDIFVGSESFLLANMRNGGAGTISATANVNPAAIHKLYANSDPLRRRTLQHNERARLDLEGLQAKLNVVRNVFGKYPMIAALKQAIAIYRNDPGWVRVRPPLVELTAEQAKTLRAELEGIGFAMKTESKN